jgi:hypothetical protein
MSELPLASGLGGRSSPEDLTTPHLSPSVQSALDDATPVLPLALLAPSPHQQQPQHPQYAKHCSHYSLTCQATFSSDSELCLNASLSSHVAPVLHVFAPKAIHYLTNSLVLLPLMLPPPPRVRPHSPSCTRTPTLSGRPPASSHRAVSHSQGGETVRRDIYRARWWMLRTWTRRWHAGSERDRTITRQSTCRVSLVISGRMQRGSITARPHALMALTQENAPTENMNRPGLCNYHADQKNISIVFYTSWVVCSCSLVPVFLHTARFSCWLGRSVEFDSADSGGRRVIVRTLQTTTTRYGHGELRSFSVHRR